MIGRSYLDTAGERAGRSSTSAVRRHRRHLDWYDRLAAALVVLASVVVAIVPSLIGGLS